LAEIKALAEMLDKDEMGLREMFDMPAILARNIDVQTTRIGSYDLVNLPNSNIITMRKVTAVSSC
jgi:hypothetical protein